MKQVSLSIILFTILNTSLFAQGTVPPLSSSIKGTIWQEKKPEDGIRDAGEKTVAGVLVKLLEAGSGRVMATALSMGDGTYELHAEAGNYVIEYVYPSEGFTLTTKRTGSDDEFNSAANLTRFTDKFRIEDGATTYAYGLGLVAKPNTVTNCTAKAPTVTVWNEDLILPKSKVSAVPLSVKLYLNESVWHPSIGVENLGTAASYDINASGQVRMQLPNGELLTASSNTPKTGTLPTYDGVQDYAGQSGISWYNAYAYAGSTYDYPAFLIDGTFMGSGDIVIPTESKSYVGISGSGNQQTLVQTYVSAGVCAVYIYGEGALPVKLISFAAKAEGNTAHLSWKTTEESNSERFEIERSADGKQWSTIGTVLAAGESSAVIPYSFTDQVPMGGQNLYRLKMVDLDQTYAYSRINQLGFEGKTTLSLYPNPVADQLFVQSAANDIASVKIFNKAGVLIKEAGSVSQPLDVRTLSAGIYAVKVTYRNGYADSRSIVIGR